jgi:hypothetical protein
MEYKIYVVGDDGHFLKSFDIEADSDAAAEAIARKKHAGHVLEIWQRGRFILRLTLDGKSQRGI